MDTEHVVVNRVCFVYKGKAFQLMDEAHYHKIVFVFIKGNSSLILCTND